MDILKNHLDGPKMKEITSRNLKDVYMIVIGQFYPGIRSICIHALNEQPLFELTYFQILEILNIPEQNVSTFFNPTFMYMFRNNGHQINDTMYNKIYIDQAANIPDALTALFYKYLEMIEETIYVVKNVEDFYV